MGYQGEMSLKGLNRNQFEAAMMKILRYRLKTVGKFKVYCTQSTFYMEPEEEDVDAFLNRFEDGMKHLQRMRR